MDRAKSGRQWRLCCVGALGSTLILAPLTGVLRGLAANGARVPETIRIVEVDPRGDPALCFGLGERPLAVAHGVLRAPEAQGLVDDDPRARSRGMMV